jgi:hypothetical protein
MENWQQIENSLCAAYQQQTAVYARALNIVEDLRATWRPDTDPNDALRAVADLMEQVAGLNAANDDLRQRWQQSARQPGTALADALLNMRTAIERLSSRIGDLEGLAKASKDQLVPELDRLLRGRQMQQAYAPAWRRS